MLLCLHNRTRGCPCLDAWFCILGCICVHMCGYEAAQSSVCMHNHLLVLVLALALTLTPAERGMLHISLRGARDCRRLGPLRCSEHQGARTADQARAAVPESSRTKQHRVAGIMAEHAKTRSTGMCTLQSSPRTRACLLRLARLFPCSRIVVSGPFYCALHLGFAGASVASDVWMSSAKALR
jgi:hypothetical protein